MSKNELYKSFTLTPFSVTDKTGEILELNKKLELLKEDVNLVTALAEWHITPELLKEYSLLNTNKKPNAIGRALKLEIPQIILDQRKSGNSRFKELVYDRTVRELKSWNERLKAVNGASNKYVSQGWSRTVNANKPTNLTPKISLSATDKQYANIELVEDVLMLTMIINGEWHKLYFNYDNERFHDSNKITLPDITIDKNNNLKFHFTAAYSYNYTNFSPDYILAVDVGIKNYATVSIVRAKDNTIVETTTLSRRVHSLANKIKKANIQVKSLQLQGKKIEASYHREANSRRKRELAIISAQEIAFLANKWGNTPVVFEDLSWVRNTMSNGRWNRGELVKRTIEYVELNGGRVFKTSAFNTSQKCYQCDNQLIFKDWHAAYCSYCNTVIDRDVNATANITKRFIVKGSHAKACATRNRSSKVTSVRVKRSRNGSPVSLKYPGRDRSKNKPTPKQVKRVKNKGVIFSNPECSTQRNDDVTVVLDDKFDSVQPIMTLTGSTIIISNELLL